MVTEAVSNKCPDCGCLRLFVNQEKGEVICRQCGIVLDDAMVDFSSEHRCFEPEDIEKKSRTGAPYDPRVCNNLMTQIGNSSDLANLSQNMRSTIKRLKKKNLWTSSPLEANFNKAFTFLKSISSYLKLPDTVEKEAARIYRICAERSLTKSRPCESIVIACLYIACKTLTYPKTLKEFVEASDYNKKLIGRCYKLICKELDIKMCPTDPVDYISKFGSVLNLSAITQTKATDLVVKSQKKGFTTGVSPVTIAATALYLSAIMNSERKTQNEVTRATGITEVTLRNNIKKMTSQLGFEVKIR